jgi:hypothetical protein
MTFFYVNLQVSGFHLPRQLTAKASEAATVRSVISSIGKLVKAGLVTLDFTEYELKAGAVGETVSPQGSEIGSNGSEPEWREAVQHVLEGPTGGSKVLLKMQ